mmetsp:Transcript_7683/g.25992  ORF Transcript_7683/g.25992 Transcript_7683/m.25992 type:complete len:84 (-) Transcript_7683:52-303(-)
MNVRFQMDMFCPSVSSPTCSKWDELGTCKPCRSVLTWLQAHGWRPILGRDIHFQIRAPVSRQTMSVANRILNHHGFNPWNPFY